MLAPGRIERRGDDTTNGFCSGKLAPCVAAVALTFRNLRLCLSPFVSGKRSTNIDRFSKGAIRFAAHVAFVACMWFNEFPFSRSFGRHVCSFRQAAFLRPFPFAFVKVFSDFL
jgi:hypothetical protein